MLLLRIIVLQINLSIITSFKLKLLIFFQLSMIISMFSLLLICTTTFCCSVFLFIIFLFIVFLLFFFFLFIHVFSCYFFLLDGLFCGIYVLKSLFSYIFLFVSYGLLYFMLPQTVCRMQQQFFFSTLWFSLHIDFPKFRFLLPFLKNCMNCSEKKSKFFFRLSTTRRALEIKSAVKKNVCGMNKSSVSF